MDWFLIDWERRERQEVEEILEAQGTMLEEEIGRNGDVYVNWRDEIGKEK